MFFFTAKLSKPKLILFSVFVVALLAYPFLLRSEAEANERAALTAETDAQRVAYLTSLGWEVAPEPLETLTLTLPLELAEPYLSYNELQKEQGFDLTPYCGSEVCRYTYRVTNYPDRADGCQADLYVSGEQIIAGDIVCTGEGGFMAGLTFPQ